MQRLAFSLPTARAILAAGTALLVGAVTLMMGAAPAQANPVLIICSGTQSVAYSPGITSQSQPVSVDAEAHFTCPTSSDSTITGGGYDTSFQTTLQCFEGPSAGTSVYRWNTDQTSTVAWTTSAPLRPFGYSTVAFTGTVTAGKFSGATLAGTLSAAPTGGPTDCYDPDGITATTGTINFTLTAL